MDKALNFDFASVHGTASMPVPFFELITKVKMQIHKLTSQLNSVDHKYKIVYEQLLALGNM